jgi:hypothetical protein
MDLFDAIAPLSPTLVKGGALPLKQLEAYLTGRDLAPEPAIASWSRFYIYDAAKQILALPKERRVAALQKIPAHIRSMVETEARRLHAIKSPVNLA